jgi:hypothetical protein
MHVAQIEVPGTKFLPNEEAPLTAQPQESTEEFGVSMGSGF